MWCNRVQDSTLTMAAVWTTEETNALIGVWGEANVQDQLDSQLDTPGCTRQVENITRDSIGTASNLNETDVHQLHIQCESIKMCVSEVVLV